MIVFLDIDGVLDYSGWFASPIRKLRKNYRTELSTYISPRNLFWVSLFCRLTKSKIVLSSSWRYSWDENGNVCKDPCGCSAIQTDKLLRRWGLDIISVTPAFSDLKKPYCIDWSIASKSFTQFTKDEQDEVEISRDKFIKYSRGAQILTWIEQNNYTGPFLIFEDDIGEVICFNCLESHIIKTSYYGYIAGFGFKHFIKAMRAYKCQEKSINQK